MKKIQISYVVSVVLSAFLLSFFNYMGSLLPVSFATMFFISAMIIILGTFCCIYIKGRLSKSRLYERKVFQGISKVRDWVYGLSDIRFFMLCCVVLFISYFPSYLALFPGIFGYDVPAQMVQYFGYFPLSSHHPLAHTYLVGVLFDLGNSVFGSYQAGFAIYIILQELIVIASLSYCFLFLKKHRIPLIAMLAGAIYVMLNPFIHILIFNATKDVMYGAFLLLLGVEFAYAVFDQKLHIISLTAFGVLSCLFRNQGIYIVFALILLAAIFRIKCKHLYKCLFAVVGLSWLFFLVTTNIISIPAGNKSEMFSVPANQVAYAVREHSERLTPEELQLVQEVLVMDAMDVYDPYTADPVKARFHTDNFFAKLPSHVWNYIVIGMKNPKEYMQAWKWLVEKYWNSQENTYRGLVLSNTFTDWNYWGIEQRHLLISQYQRLADKVHASHLNIWQKPETCLWLFIAVLAVAIVRKDKKRFVAILPFVLYFGTILLGPVALVRYLYPITISTPFLIGCIFIKERKR